MHFTLLSSFKPHEAMIRILWWTVKLGLTISFDDLKNKVQSLEGRETRASMYIALIAENRVSVA